MAGMIQKIIKVGTSGAVVIPKRALQGVGFKIGQPISVIVYESHQTVLISKPEKRIDEVSKWTDKFIKKYRKSLDALSRK